MNPNLPDKTQACWKAASSFFSSVGRRTVCLVSHELQLSLSLPFPMTLNVVITALPRDVRGRKDPPKQTSLCVQKGSRQNKTLNFRISNGIWDCKHENYQIPSRIYMAGSMPWNTSFSGCPPSHSQNFPQSPDFCMFVRMYSVPGRVALGTRTHTGRQTRIFTIKEKHSQFVCLYFTVYKYPVRN